MMKIFKYIFQDWHQNSHDIKIRLILSWFRIGQLLRRLRCFRFILFCPYYLFYKVVVFWLFHIELPLELEAGPGLRIFHGYSLVIHANSHIGQNVTLRHCTTLGNKGYGEDASDAPRIGDSVEIGCGAIIIGKITIGNNAIIGAGAVVTKDVPPNGVAVGNPVRILHTISDQAGILEGKE